MTDIDRMRRAADVLGAFANQDRMHGSRASAVQEAATAGLLRAVADAAEYSQVHGNGTPPADSYIGIAALALADSILAVSDE